MELNAPAVIRTAKLNDKPVVEKIQNHLPEGGTAEGGFDSKKCWLYPRRNPDKLVVPKL